MSDKREYIVTEGKLCERMPNHLQIRDIARVTSYGDQKPTLYFLGPFHRGTDLVTFDNFLNSGGVTFHFKDILCAERLASVGTVQHEVLSTLILENALVNNTMTEIRKKMEELREHIDNLKSLLGIL